MLFKELATFKVGTKAIDYRAIDPSYDEQTNKVFANTSLLREGGQEFVVGSYTGLLTLNSWDGVLSDNSPPIRKITPRSFEARFTNDEYKSIYKKLIKAKDRLLKDQETTEDVIYVRADEQLSKASYVDLDDPLVGSTLDFYISQGDIHSERKVGLLVDGTEEERYE